MKIRPIKRNILVKMEPRTEKVGEIYLADKFKKAPEWGEVVAVGQEAKLLDVGYKVYIQRHVGTLVTTDSRSQELIMVDERKVIGFHTAEGLTNKWKKD